MKFGECQLWILRRQKNEDKQNKLHAITSPTFDEYDNDTSWGTVLLRCAWVRQSKVNVVVVCLFLFVFQGVVFDVPSSWDKKIQVSGLCIHSLKPWPNGLASPQNSTQVFDLRSTCVSFGYPLALPCGGITMTCVDFGRTHIRTQVDARFSHFGHPTQVDASWSQVDASQQYRREIHDFLRLAWTCEPTCESVWPPIASPYARSGFENLCRLASTCESVGNIGTIAVFVRSSRFPLKKAACPNGGFWMKNKGGGEGGNWGV